MGRYGEIWGDMGKHGGHGAARARDAAECSPMLSLQNGSDLSDPPSHVSRFLSPLPLSRCTVSAPPFAFSAASAARRCSDFHRTENSSAPEDLSVSGRSSAYL